VKPVRTVGDAGGSGGDAELECAGHGPEISRLRQIYQLPALNF
jgi:hypothetical protein